MDDFKVDPELLKKWDREYIWHPFTQMLEWMREENLIIAEGEGNYLIDTDGKRYIDGVSSLWVNIHGHRKKEIDEALKEQINRISHSTLLGLSNVPSILLAKKLIDITPASLKKVFYSDNGSTAVEIALKISFQYWQNLGLSTRKKFISLKNAYHGDTLGAVSVGGIDLFHKIYNPLLFPSYRIPSPYCYRCEFNLNYPSCNLACADPLEEILSKNAEEIAALIIEPIVQAAGGIIVSPPGYLKKIYEISKKHKILFIADEVATGFGRTGKMFACDHENINPDIMAISKGITGGYLPLAATLTTDDIYNAFLGEYEELKTFFHGHSYTGNPLACVAALANIDIFEKQKVIEIIQQKICHLENLLKDFWNLKHVGDIRHKGLMAGIELVKDREKKEPFPINDRIGHKVILEARKKGVILRPLGNVIVIMPPLSITNEELSYLLEAVYHSIKRVTET